MAKIKYNTSRLQGASECFYCGTQYELDRHEFLCGRNRALAAKYGLWVYVCRSCHIRFQNDSQAMLIGKKFSQRVFEVEIGSREEFIKIFDKSYLED